jgi:hypothetical protein
MSDDEQAEKSLVEKELNVDYWFYDGREHRRGDLVQVDPENNAHHQQLVDQGVLVDPGFAEKLREEQEQAEAEAAERKVELIELRDEEAHRKVRAQEALSSGVLPSEADKDGDAEGDEPTEVAEGESGPAEKDSADDSGPKHSAGSERTYVRPTPPRQVNRRR